MVQTDLQNFFGGIRTELDQLAASDIGKMIRMIKLLQLCYSVRNCVVDSSVR